MGFAITHITPNILHQYSTGIVSHPPQRTVSPCVGDIQSRFWLYLVSHQDMINKITGHFTGFPFLLFGSSDILVENDHSNLLISFVKYALAKNDKSLDLYFTTSS